jgi:hypothetical protein
MSMGRWSNLHLHKRLIWTIGLDKWHSSVRERNNDKPYLLPMLIEPPTMQQCSGLRPPREQVDRRNLSRQISLLLLLIFSWRERCKRINCRELQ